MFEGYNARIQAERKFQFYLNSRILAMMANINRDSKKKATPYQESDFMPKEYK